MSDFTEATFQAKIDTALRHIRRVLDANREPHIAKDVHHVYEDKFLLAEMVTRTAFAAQLNALEALGLDRERLATVRGLGQQGAMLLRLCCEERCELDRKEVEEVETGTHLTEVKQKGVFRDSTTTVEQKVFTKVEKFYWKYRVRFELLVVSATDAQRRLVLQQGEGVHEIVTKSDKPPRPKVAVKPAIELELGTLLGSLDEALLCHFEIDRDEPDCHTPRRNEDILRALRWFRDALRFGETVIGYFRSEVFPVQTETERDLSMIDDAAVFVPVLPILLEPGDEGGPVTLAASDVHTLLEHQQRTLTEALDTVARGFAESQELVTARLARLLVTALHIAEIARYFASSVDFIEKMLDEQLVAAIGKVVTADDFTEYMRFHDRKLFAAPYAPVPFHHAIRRPDHYPEGVISIERQRDGEHRRGADTDPISTHVRVTHATQPMSFLINAATKVTFHGERYLHGWVDHRFAGRPARPLVLAARARELSSFILLVGRIASAELFEPRAAMIISNRDDLRIPLLLETIPTPKEFKDAIESLSPEQQRFAKAYRAMQLESTLFGLCVVQIKPQLEKLLKLPDDSLTKEIKLTQELLELFTIYQIPSDLVAYAGEPSAPVELKVNEVAGHVRRMREIIQEQKDTELADQRQRQAHQFAEVEGSMAMQVTHVNSPGPPPPPPGFAPMGFGPPGAVPQGAPMPPPFSPAPAARSAAPALPPAAMPMAAPPPPPAAQPAPQPALSAPAASEAAATPARAPAVTAPVSAAASGEPSDDDGQADYTRIPVELDRRFEELDEDSALRPTILEPGPVWTLSRRKSLLSEPRLSNLGDAAQRRERDRAFDLLDALSRSGSLPIDSASLHVVVAATHGFDETLRATVIERSVNPIEKVERSCLIVASTIHRVPAEALVRADQRERVQAFSPALFSPELPMEGEATAADDD